MTRPGNAVPYRPPLPGWAAAALVRPPPRTARPFPDETLDSYLWRLGRANGLNPAYFTDYVKGAGKRRPPFPPDAVIALSGQPARSMRYAILELCTPQELAVMHIAGRPRPDYARKGAACDRCALARSPGARVERWMRAEDVICPRHRRWTAGDGQVDLAGHEAVIAAGELHRRVIRAQGRDAARRAFHRASEIVREWADRGAYKTRFEEQLRRFHGPGWSLHRRDPTLLASLYPPAVDLARLLADPAWTALALSPEGNAAFVAEVRRTVEPAYEWNPRPYWRHVEPLARTLLEERKLEETLRTYDIRLPPAPSRRRLRARRAPAGQRRRGCRASRGAQSSELTVGADR